MADSGAARKAAWIGVAIAVAVVAGVIAAVVSLWNAVGDVEIGVAGWLAMAFGVVATLGLGIGLMALVFISSRRGYDERSGRDPR